MSETDDTQIASTFDWTDKTPTPAVQIDLKVNRRTYYFYLGNRTLSDIKALRPCDKIWKKGDRTTQSSAPLHAGRRAERVLPLPAGGRKKCAQLENLRATQLLRAKEL